MGKKRPGVHQFGRVVPLPKTGVNLIQSGERVWQSFVAGETTRLAVGCAQLPCKSLLLPSDFKRSIEGLNGSVDAAG